MSTYSKQLQRIRYSWSGTTETLCGPNGQTQGRVGAIALQVLQTQGPSKVAVEELNSFWRLQGKDGNSSPHWGPSPWWADAESPNWRDILDKTSYTLKAEWYGALTRSVLCCFDVWRELQSKDALPPGSFFEPLMHGFDGIASLYVALHMEWLNRSIEKNPLLSALVSQDPNQEHGLHLCQLFPNWLREIGGSREGLTWKLSEACPSPLQGIQALVWRSATLGLSVGTLAFCGVCGHLFMRSGNQQICSQECGNDVRSYRKKIRDRVTARIKRGSVDVEIEARERLEKLDRLYAQVLDGALTFEEYRSACENEFPCRSSKWDT